MSGINVARHKALVYTLAGGLAAVAAILLTSKNLTAQAGAPRRKDSAMDELILETRGLTKRYGGVHALEGAAFTLRRGEHVAIMGDCGAGKSTFVRQITGVEKPTEGTI
jgi:ABC-type polysaccharide/polyol phosphate transport system ATPase subunit